MRKRVKLCLAFLSVVTIAVVSATVAVYSTRASPTLFGDIRDMFPTGYWIKAYKCDHQPTSYVNVTSDPYVKAAIDSINETRRWDWVEPWMVERDLNKTYVIEMVEMGWVWVGEESEYVQLSDEVPLPSGFKGFFMPDVYWIPDGQYYDIHHGFLDGVPEWRLKMLPPAEQTAPLIAVGLAVPWGAFAILTKKGKIS